MREKRFLYARENMRGQERKKEMSCVVYGDASLRSRSTTLMRFSATRVGPASSMTLTRLSVHA